MQNLLAIDVGNTRMKLGFFSGNALVAEHSFSNANVRDLKRILRKHKPSHAILSNVGRTLNAQLIALLKNETKLTELNPKTKIPIGVNYRRGRPGADRIALAVFAHSLYPKHNALVVSAGSCITYNLVSKEADFLGGSITPGLNMRLRAMHHFTARLPRVRLSAATSITADTTADAMNTGSVLGAAYEINGFVKDYKRRYEGLKVILTGGDAERLQPHLNFRIFARPNAVLEGLHRILQYNTGAL